jgi:hypothetical protein
MPLPDSQPPADRGPAFGPGDLVRIRRTPATERAGAAGSVGIVVARLCQTLPEHFLAAHPELREAVDVEFDRENCPMALGPESLELVERASPPSTLPDSVGRYGVSAGGGALTWLRTVMRRIRHLFQPQDHHAA